MNVTRKDPIEGPAGTGTEYELGPVVEGDPPDWGATVAFWHFVCPGQSPAWQDYRLSVVHLRPIEGESQPANVLVEGATHEFLLVALDPAFTLNLDDPGSWRFLVPLNLIHQVRLPSDEKAAELAALAAEAVVAGTLWAEPPLSGQTTPWVEALDSSAEHLRGEHDAGPSPADL